MEEWEIERDELLKEQKKRIEEGNHVHVSAHVLCFFYFAIIFCDLWGLSLSNLLCVPKPMPHVGQSLYYLFLETEDNLFDWSYYVGYNCTDNKYINGKNTYLYQINC